MSDNDEPLPPVPKSAKKKKEMTPEQLARLRENLKKGRETALNNRKKRAMEKKIDADEAEKARDEKIAKAMLGEKPHKEEISELKEEIKRLKSDGGNKDEIKELRSQMAAMVEIIKAVAVGKPHTPSSPHTPKPKPKPREEIPQPSGETPHHKAEAQDQAPPTDGVLGSPQEPTPKPVKKVADVSRRVRHVALIGFF